VKVPLESSKDTKDYKENVLEDNTNGIGGSMLTAKKQNRIQVEVKINHNGEINRARYMP
jgi:histone-binding protein RBBP4